MNRIKDIFNPDYFLAVPTESRYEIYFLYLSIAILVAVIGAKIYLRLNKRPKAYLELDRRWFWGYLIISLLGMFVWFSRSQELPTFGTRLATYVWFNTIWIYTLYLYFYYKRTFIKDLASYHEKKRKEKYLKR